MGFLAIGNWQLAIIFWVTVIIAVMDWETMLISDWLVAIWAVLAAIGSQQSAVSSIYGLLVGVGVIGGLWLITQKKAMGEGDIGIAAVMGWWLGWPKIAIGLWAAFVSGALYGLFLIILKKASKKTQIAFGPWLILGAWAGYLWGEKIIKFLFYL